MRLRLASIILLAARGVCGAETPEWPRDPPAEWVTYHLAHPGPGLDIAGAYDPSAAFYYQGRYHLHYMYKTNSTDVFYAHVSSTDMVHWKWHPTVLGNPTIGHGMYSGTGFFTKEGSPVMIYAGHRSQKNWLSYGLDDNLDKWSKPEVVPNMRRGDPDCWLNGDTYYAASGGRNLGLMKSSDLKNWRDLGDLLHADYPADLGVGRGTDISCPNMFKIGNNLRIGTVDALFELKQGEAMNLRVFIDRNLVEIFANDRQAVAFAHQRSHASANTRLFSNGSDTQVTKVTAWKMKSIYEGDTVFKRD